MSAVAQTPGGRASRYAWGAEAVLRVLATQTPEASDLYWGLREVAEEAAKTLERAVDSADSDALQEASCRYARAIAIVATVAREIEKDMLLAGESLMEATKQAIEAELDRLTGKAVQA